MQMTADSVEYHAGGAGRPGTDAAGAPGAWGAAWQGSGSGQNPGATPDPAALAKEEN